MLINVCFSHSVTKRESLKSLVILLNLNKELKRFNWKPTLAAYGHLDKEGNDKHLQIQSISDKLKISLNLEKLSSSSTCHLNK